METMKIRAAQPDDINEVVLLSQEHATYEKSDYSSAGKAKALSEHLFQPNPPFICLLIEWQGDIVGYFTLMKQYSTWDATFYIYLDCLFLREEVRGLGFGRQIMHEIKAHALRENCKLVQWQTPDFNQGAIGFYRKMGAISKTKERFFWEL